MQRLEAIKWRLHGCPYQKSYPNVGMMKSAELRNRHDGSAAKDGSSEGRVLIQSEMSPPRVVVV